MRVSRVLLVGGLVALSRKASAHADQPPTPHDLWSTWTFDPWVLIPLLTFVLLYVTGQIRLRRTRYSRAASRHAGMVFLAAGIFFLLVALVSPLDGLGESLFSAHMTQHMVLMLLAAPFIVLAAPLPVVLVGLPRPAREFVVQSFIKSRLWRVLGRWLVSPLFAAAVQILVLLAWHAPVLFRSAQLNDAVHSLMHATFFGAAVMFWRAVIKAARGNGASPVHATIACLVTLKASGLLGIIFLLSPRPFYPALYSALAAEWSTTPLRDQQVAALAMLVPGMVVYFGTAVGISGVWLSRLRRA